ncbi:MAG TPA: class F sortase [Acidothermaceae bacterium]|nr:class F sortase [Acidothermaceae bacterium]
MRLGHVGGDRAADRSSKRRIGVVALGFVAMAVFATGCGSGSSPKAAVKAAPGTTAATSAVASPSDAIDSASGVPESSAPASPVESALASPTPGGLPGLALGAAPLAKSAPVRITVPTIGVDSVLMSLGLLADGSLQVPPSGFPAGWYTGAPTPGQLGPAIIVGHIDWGGHPGVFYRLRDLKPGAEINVTRANGSVAVFRVSSVQEFSKDAFPTKLVYGNTAYAGLRLITCGGAFDSKLHSYEDDIIAFAELVPPSGT